jgi:tripartite-type tricarboxylate transporter receptor subunit TctC
MRILVAEGAVWAPHVNSDELRLLVTFASSRSKLWPVVPTLQETGTEPAADSAYGLAGATGMGALKECGR